MPVRKYLLAAAAAAAIATPAVARDHSGYIGIDAGALWSKSRVQFTPPPPANEVNDQGQGLRRVWRGLLRWRRNIGEIMKGFLIMSLRDDSPITNRL